MLKATSATSRTGAAALAAVLLAAGPPAAAGGEPRPDPGDAERAVTVRTGQAVQPRFAGAGYHVFDHAFAIEQDHLEQVVAKRWREVNPSFVRMNHEWNWDASTMDRMIAFMRRFQRETGTEIYLTTWNPRDVPAGAERAAYARLIVDQLERLVRKEGIVNLKWYCMTNELSLSGWGRMVQDLPRFRDYHRLLDRELRSRKLDVRLLATDASPVGYWHTIEWAARNMDDITGIYGGHHYVNDFALEDERFYPWFLGRVEWGVGIARACGKDFILGEFGPKQDGRTINGIRMDQCVYWGTPKEPLVPVQVCEAAIAAINAGVYALGYWTFMDFPDRPQTGYANKWGLFKWSGKDCSTRPTYYAYGLLSKFLRGPATTYRVQCADPRLRIAAVEHHSAGTWSIAVVNRNKSPTRLAVALAGRAVDAVARKYVYDPAGVPTHPFGDLQPPAGKVELKAGRFADTVGAGTLTVYTTAYDDRPPAKVGGLRAEAADGGKVRLTWQPSADADLCYYRVYRAVGREPATEVSDQIASTIATRYVDAAPPAGGGCWYGVVAVDQSGNAGPSVAVRLPRPPGAGSGPGAAAGPENALRDPAIRLEPGRACLLCPVAGESGVAIAEIDQP